MPAVAYACLSGGTVHPRDVGGGGDVHTFPVVYAGGSVHPPYRSQLPPVAAEVPELRRHAGPLVFVVGTVLGYLRVPSGGQACEWYVPPMRPVSEAGLSAFGDRFAGTRR